MTAAQMGRRLGISQPSVTGLEHAEVNGSITLNTLQRAAEALGCRVVYVLVPDKPLAETVHERAQLKAAIGTAAIEQTMRLENQAVDDPRIHDELVRRAAEELMRRPSRLWEDER